MHHRTLLRNYVVEMLKASVDVGDKVFPNRPSRAFIEEAPCLMVYFGNESIEIESGDRYCAHEYNRNMQLKIDILSVEDEDHLDYLAEQIEHAFADDWFLGKGLEGFDADKPTGLSLGVTLSGVDPYSVDTDSELAIYGQTITFNVPYITDIYSDKKMTKFNEYYFEILRADGVTTDTVLSSGEGEL